MGMVIKLSIYELKTYIFNKSLMLLLGISIAGIYIFPPYNNVVLKTEIILIYLLPFIMVIFFSRILSKDFEYKTYKILFTSRLTRFQIILYKLLTVLEISIILLLLYQILHWFSSLLEMKTISIDLIGKGIINSIAVFLVYAFIVASFTFFITSITGKFSVTFIISYICFNDFVKIFLQLVSDKSKNENISKIVEYIPFTIATNGFSLQYYSFKQIIWLLIYSFLFLFIAFFIIEKRDYR